MASRIFISVPDGPYWEAKRAREASEELEAVREASLQGLLEDERGEDNERAVFSEVYE